MKFFLIIITTPILLSAQTENKYFFTSLNSPIYEKKITSIATYSLGLNWIGTLEGIVCYNGERWHIINTKTV